MMHICILQHESKDTYNTRVLPGEFILQKIAIKTFQTLLGVPFLSLQMIFHFLWRYNFCIFVPLSLLFALILHRSNAQLQDLRYFSAFKSVTIKKKVDGKFWRIGHIERNIPYNRDLGLINKIEDSSHTPL